MTTDKIEDRIRDMEVNLAVAQLQYRKLHDRMNALKDELRKDKNTAERWRAADGEPYYFLSSTDGTCCKVEHGNPVDGFRNRSGNYFKTESEADEYYERLKVYRELMDWSDGGLIHIAYYYHMDQIAMPSEEDLDEVKLCPFTFSSYRRASSCIEAIGKERLKKYWFGV